MVVCFWWKKDARLVRNWLGSECLVKNCLRHHHLYHSSIHAILLHQKNAHHISTSLIQSLNESSTTHNPSHTTNHTSPITHHQSHTTHHTPSITLPITHHQSHTTHHTPSITLPITHHPSHTTLHTPPITHHTPSITHHPSHTIHHTPPITHHPSHTTHPTPPFSGSCKPWTAVLALVLGTTPSPWHLLNWPVSRRG